MDPWVFVGMASVTGITRTATGDLMAVVLTCDGTADMVGVETDGDPDANTDFVWETERTRDTLRGWPGRSRPFPYSILGTNQDGRSSSQPSGTIRRRLDAVLELSPPPRLTSELT